MDNDDLDRLYNGILDLLRNQGIGWVADQVIEGVGLGRIVQREFKALQTERMQTLSFESSLVESSSGRRGPREDVLVSEPYNQEDRLRLLLDAIEEAVVNSRAMEEHLFDYLASNQSDINSIEFYSEETDSDTMRIERHGARSRYDATERLKSQLDQLRQEL